jgi:hypothetical protein
MRLIRTDTHEIVEYQAKPFPPYVILSHRWGKDGDEVTFQDMTTRMDQVQGKPGFKKLKRFCEKARENHFSFVWIDTCW